MKKSIIIYIFFILLIPFSGFASSGKAGNSITWNLDNEGVLTFKGTGKMKDFKETPYRPVLVKSVVIGEGITSIGNNAFRNCSNLSNISISSTVKEIGNNAFDGCKSMPEINIPYGVTSIGNNAFENCILFTEIDVPGSVKTIGEKAFKNCKNLVKIRIPASLVSLGKNAFKNCRYIEKIYELPDFLTANVASHYNLYYDLVDSYWKNMEQSAETTNLTTENNQESLTTEQKENRRVNRSSDVDVSIPLTGVKNEKTFAVIVSNENYTKMPKVPYSLNDGITFYNYCKNTLGIPEQNIIFYKDATSGQMRDISAELGMANRIVGGEMRVIFYYSGHGAPDPATNEGYLIPVDASRVNPSTCMSLSELYTSLGKLNVELSTVFLDACFSGGDRNGGNLLAANGERVVKIKQQEMKPTGNMVVFTATDGDQTALPYDEKGHGIFTYFLLKKLKESGGSVSLAELADYIKKNVASTAYKENRKEQTPTVSTSTKIADSWRNKRLNN